MIGIVAGGTGGHIYPGLACYEILSKRGIVVEWLGSLERVEGDIIQKEGITFIGFNLKRRSDGLFWFVTNIHSIVKIIRHFKKNDYSCIISTGGYVSFYWLIGAMVTKTPFILLEQNVIPGRVNRFMSRYAQKICVGFEESKQYFPSHVPVVYTGNPLRGNVERNCWNKTGKLLIIGGSLGAFGINKAIKELVLENYFAENNMSVIWVSGKRDFHDCSNAVKDHDEIMCIEYAEKMEELYSQAKLCIARAGAISLSEISLCGIPAIIVPYPFSKDGHQHANAKVFGDKKAAIVIEEDTFLREHIKTALGHLWNNLLLLEEMHRNTLEIVRKNAASTVVSIVEEIL